MPLRRSRLPPSALVAALLVAALLISFALPPPSPPPLSPTVCCAVASALPLARADCGVQHARAHASCWHVSLEQRGLYWAPLIEDVRTALRSNTDLLTASVRRCCALGSCIPAAVPCKRPLHAAAARLASSRAVIDPEDPSDALWLRAYDSGGELVVLARASLLTLAIFLAAIAVEGAPLSPRRSGLAQRALGALLLIALSALLQLLLIPRAWQAPLWGAGPLQTAACVAAVLTGAALLPAAVLAVQTVAVLNVHYALLTLQVLFWVCVGLVHFLAALAVFYAKNLWIQLRVLYAGDGADEDSAQDVYIAQLNVSYDFVSAVGANALLRRVAASANNAAKLVLRSAIGATSYNNNSVDGESARGSSADDLDVVADDVSITDGSNTSPVRPRASEFTPLLDASQDDDVLVRADTF